LQRFAVIAKTRVIISLIDLLFVVLLTYLFGLYGFFISLSISAILSFLILFIIIKPKIFLKKDSFKEHKEILHRIIKFSKVNIFLGAYYFGSFYLLRKIIADNLGIEKLGLFFAAFSLSSQMGLIVQSISFYSVSELSKDIGDEEKTKNINDYIYLVLIVSNPILVMAIMYQDIVTRIFFSDSFDEMTSFFYIMIFAQFITFSLSIFATTIWTAERMKEHAIVSIIYHALTVLMAWSLIRSYGLYGVAMGFLVGTIVAHLLAYNFVKKIITFEFRENVLKIMAVSVLLMVSSVYLRDSMMIIKITIIFFSVSYSIFALEQHHKTWLLSKIKR